jgi:hypothetical protein
MANTLVKREYETGEKRETKVVKKKEKLRW